MPDCSSVQKSLAWCQGKPELPGVKRRIYYISKYDVLQWPVLQHDSNGRLTSASYSGDFVLRADAKWKFIDIISDKSQLTSEAQGEYPSQTQLNKLVAVHPGVDQEASAAAAYLNNNDNVFLVEDMRGAVRVVGSDKWPTKTTVAQDLGQGATGSTSTTINVEATDECPAPFYSGSIDTDDGTFTANPSQATGGGNSSGSGNNSGNSGNSGSGGNTSTGGTPSYNNTVVINGTSRTVSKNSSVSIAGPLKSVKITGANMNNVSLSYNPADEDENPELFFTITKNATEASWTGNIPGPDKVRIYRGYSADGSTAEFWFEINLTSSSSSGGSTGGSTGGNTGGNTGGSTGGSTTPTTGGIYFNYNVLINNDTYNVSSGIAVIREPLTSIKVTGTNLSGLSLLHLEDGHPITEELTVSSDKTSATWTGNLAPRDTAYLKRAVDPSSKTWLTIEILHEDDEWIDYD